MRRRDFVTILGGAFGWPIAARSQQTPIPVIGFVNSASRETYQRPLSAFIKGLAEAGYVEGHNVAIEYRWAEGQYDKLPSLVADLAQRKVSVIAATSTPAALAAKAAISTIPIVFTTSGDPIRLGLVSNLSHPAGNITGATQLNVEVAPKRLELIHEVLPKATKIGLLVNPTNPLADPVVQSLRAVAASLQLNLQVVNARNEDEVATVFETLTPPKSEALVIGTDVFFNSLNDTLAGLALRHGLPSIYQYPEYTAAGGLISYGGNVAESYRLAGVYVGRLLKGEKPADLPVQEVTKVELIINLKTAKALGVTFPLSLLGRADAVIE